MAKRKNMFYDIPYVEDLEPTLDNDAVQSGLTERQQVNINGGIVKTKVGDDCYHERTNQEHGGVF